MLDALVPTFILQPLVENAVKHGVERRTEGGQVTVEAARDGDALVLRVVNDAPAEAPVAASPTSRTGVGIRNTRARLEQLYGTRAAVHARARRRARGGGGGAPPIPRRRSGGAADLGSAAARRGGRRGGGAACLIRCACSSSTTSRSPACASRTCCPRIDGAQIVGTAANGVEAIEQIRSLKPDLVFLDVQMPGKTGVEVVREIGPDAMPATIFVTAFDQFAVEAFDVAAVDYLVKPFDDERLEAAFERARSRLALEGLGELREKLLSVLQSPTAAPLADPRTPGPPDPRSSSSASPSNPAARSSRSPSSRSTTSSRADRMPSSTAAAGATSSARRCRRSRSGSTRRSSCACTAR